jgi:hypothetical protein
MVDLASMAGLVKVAKDIQKPISLAAALMALLIIFHQIVGKIHIVDQTILPSIVSWLGSITLITIILAIGSYSVPFFLKGRLGSLVVGSPTVTSRQPAGAPGGARAHRGASATPVAPSGETPDQKPPVKPTGD